MRKKKELVVDKEWCKGCGICVAFCPNGAIVLDEQGKAWWAHPEKCKNCGLCELRCPDIAIELTERKNQCEQM